MIFGSVPLAEAAGALLAHSLQAGNKRFRKGGRITAEMLSELEAAGITQITVARPEAGDIGEDAAAAVLAEALTGPGLRATRAFTGRVNLEASDAGVLRVDATAITALNMVDPGITVATVPDYSRVSAGMMVATVKIIPYAVAREALASALASLPVTVLRVASPRIPVAELILTRTPGFADKLLAKGEAAVRDRLSGLGVRLGKVVTVAHDTSAVAGALRAATAPLVLILGASATSDARDVCPAGLVAAGGRLARFGMPVDPGNLLFLGDGPAGVVVGLPGCARSPALNGADWVLERLVCGEAVTDTDIAAMGVGGLLKEIPIRPHPRAILSPPAVDPRVEVVLLAAGRARRMRGKDKLREEIDGRPLLARSIDAAHASVAAAVHVVVPPDAAARAAIVAASDAQMVAAPDADLGMGSSLATGMAAVSAEADAVIVALADMPDVTAADYNRLIAAFDVTSAREICRATAPDGTPGHPVLFGRRFFEGLHVLSGDLGARAVVRAGQDFLVDVPLEGAAAITDLDTPEAWAAYRAGAAIRG